MTPADAQAQALYEPEDPALLAANLNVGVRLFVSAIVFVFVAFVFAFFYLKAVNSNGQWRPAHVDPSAGYGIAILIGVLATTAVFQLARRALSSGGAWRTLTGVALGLSLATVVVQVLELTGTGFGVTGGGYASVFYGWNALLLAFWLGAVYWIETLFAGTFRPAPSTEDAVGFQLADAVGPSADACFVYLVSLAGIEVVTYVLLYLIK